MVADNVPRRLSVAVGRQFFILCYCRALSRAGLRTKRNFVLGPSSKTGLLRGNPALIPRISRSECFRSVSPVVGKTSAWLRSKKERTDSACKGTEWKSAYKKGTWKEIFFSKFYNKSRSFNSPWLGFFSPSKHRESLDCAEATPRPVDDLVRHSGNANKGATPLFSLERKQKRRIKKNIYKKKKSSWNRITVSVARPFAAAMKQCFSRPISLCANRRLRGGIPHNFRLRQLPESWLFGSRRESSRRGRRVRFPANGKFSAAGAAPAGQSDATKRRPDFQDFHVFPYISLPFFLWSFFNDLSLNLRNVLERVKKKTFRFRRSGATQLTFIHTRG